jgi:hypothetical protein
MFSWLFGRTPPPPPPTYDTILLINLHGGTSLTKTDIKTCEILPMPEGMKATFLEATPCGVGSLSFAGYWKNMVKMMITIHLTEPTKQFAQECQRVFRKEKQNFLNKVDFSDIASKEEIAAFRRNQGWEMVESTTDYVNKYYHEDPDPSMELNEVLILYSEHPDFPIGVLTDVNSRKSLLRYLHKEGVRNPLIIDASCSGIVGSPQAKRYASRELTKRQRTGGLTKRPKVKKLIHFA